MTSGGPPVRALISDFGGVLTTPLVEAFAVYHEHSGISAEELGSAMAQAETAHGEHPLFELEKGTITEDEFRDRLDRHLPGKRLGTFRDTYFEHLHPNEPMIALMRELRESGVRMGMLTNNVREWAPLWRAKLPDIDDLFELVVDSAFVGMRKPDPEIYLLTVERMGGLEPQECVFLDDMAINCDAARALGMMAVRFETNEQSISEVRAAFAPGVLAAGVSPKK